MAETHFYGLKCKNPECGADIVLGKYQTEAKAGGVIDIPLRHASWSPSLPGLRQALSIRLR